MNSLICLAYFLPPNIMKANFITARIYKITTAIYGNYV